MTQTAHRLRIRDVVVETHDARSLIFDVPEELRDRFRYRPGQFLTIAVPSDRAPVARCYSLASSPNVDDHLKVTVKRTDGGYASNWLCDHAAAGGELEVLAPAGSFTPPSLDERFLLIAGGSGITPVMSILTSVLVAGSGTVALFYANRDDRAVIFGAQLRELTAKFPDRLLVIHWLESIQGLPSPGPLTPLFKQLDCQRAFVCGPSAFMESVVDALRQIGHPRNKTHLERFVSLTTNPFTTAAPSSDDAVSPVSLPDTSVRVDLDGQSHMLAWPADTRLLDVLLAAGLDAPHSCREGACSACECRLLAGRAHMVNNQVLDDKDIDDGALLACQALPRSADVHVTYEFE